MAEILVKAIDHTHPDPEKDRRGAYKKGMPVVVFDDGHDWGADEGPPKFVVVKIPGVSVDAVRHYIDSWKLSIAYTIVSSNLADDSFRLRIVSEYYNAKTGEGKITRERVETYIGSWGGTGISVTDNAVEFDVTILNAIKSARFWRGVDRTGCSLTQLSYTQTGGVHECRISYSGITVNVESRVKEILDRVAENGTLISHKPAQSRIDFLTTRNQVRGLFQDDIKGRVDGIICRRRRRLAAALVAEALEAGGTVTKSSADVAAATIDQTVE